LCSPESRQKPTFFGRKLGSDSEPQEVESQKLGFGAQVLSWLCYQGMIEVMKE